MNQVSHELKTYADAGFRTAEDWNSLGRVVQAGSVCRAVASHRGVESPLFSRDQTLARPAGPRRRDRRGDAAGADAPAQPRTGADEGK